MAREQSAQNYRFTAWASLALGLIEIVVGVEFLVLGSAWHWLIGLAVTQVCLAVVEFENAARRDRDEPAYSLKRAWANRHSPVSGQRAAAVRYLVLTCVAIVVALAVLGASISAL